MRISPIINHSPYSTCGVQKTSPKNNNVSFGYIREDAATKEAMKKLGFKYWLKPPPEYDIPKLGIYGENGQLKFKLNLKTEERAERRAEVEAFEKATEKFDGTIRTKEILAAIVNAFKTIFPPPEGEPYTFNTDENFFIN